MYFLHKICIYMYINMYYKYTGINIYIYICIYTETILQAYIHNVCICACVYTAVLPKNEKLHVCTRHQVDKINEYNTQGGFSMSNINLFALKEEHASKKSKTDDAHAR